jgi:TonB family protein
MKLTPLVPAMPEQDGTPRWGLAASVVVHGLLLLAVLSLAVQHLPKDGNPAPSYELMFQPPSGAAPSSDPPQTPSLPPMQPADVPPPPDAMSGPPAPTPSTTPDPKSTTSPPPAADAAPPPTPQLAPQVMPTPSPAPRPTVAEPAPASVAPPAVPLASPEEEASVPLPTPLEPPPTVEQPAVRLEMPPTEAAPAMPEAIMPQVPEPLPPIQAKPQPRPVRPVVKLAPRSAVGTLSNPMDLSLSPAAPRPAARGGSVASRSLDLSPSREQTGPARSDPYAKIRAANASADWNRGLLSYWLQHRYYPEQAAANGDQGAVTIQLTVNRSGRVENVEVISRSGSQWLDMAAVATWRNAKLPAFTNEMREERITFPIPIQYYLIQR